MFAEVGVYVGEIHTKTRTSIALSFNILLSEPIRPFVSFRPAKLHVLTITFCPPVGPALVQKGVFTSFGLSCVS